ncbi:MAG: hypothetical protein IJJ63_03995 [Bacilli bacterium]|nr:hypothetical protein [Bacilli bacterium]
MKKLFILLSISVLFITGCSIKKLDNDNIENNIDTLMSVKVSMYNEFYEGYKYYLPKALRFVDKDEYNAVLMDFHNNRYYLYVDAISYYHKTSNNYEESSKSYLSKRLDYGKKTGYIQIDEVDSNYFVQFVFHYAKMEAYVPKDEIVDVVSNMCCVLRSVKFHDAILDSLIGENILDYKEEDFSLFKADSSKENFLDVVEREETDLYKKDLEDEKIDLDN